MKRETQFLRKKQWILSIFVFFVKNKISLGIRRIMVVTHTYLTVSKMYI
jgi:hypothetical protein